MAQFRAGIQGNKGAVTRLGSKASGIHTFTDGWHSGVDVHGYVDDQGRDVFEVYATGGSLPSTSPKLVARIVTGEPIELLPGAWGDSTSTLVPGEYNSDDLDRIAARRDR